MAAPAPAKPTLKKAGPATLKITLRSHVASCPESPAAQSAEPGLTHTAGNANTHRAEMEPSYLAVLLFLLLLCAILRAHVLCRARRMAHTSACTHRASERHPSTGPGGTHPSSASAAECLSAAPHTASRPFVVALRIPFVEAAATSGAASICTSGSTAGFTCNLTQLDPTRYGVVSRSMLSYGSHIHLPQKQQRSRFRPVKQQITIKLLPKSVAETCPSCAVMGRSDP